MSSRQWRFADFRLDSDNACLWHMKLSIKDIKPCAKATHLALMVVDHTEIRTEIVELTYGDLPFAQIWR